MMERMIEPEQSPTSAPSREFWILAGILALGLIIRIAFARNVDLIVPRNDERAYIDLAAAILRHGEYPSLFRPPGLPGFIAATVKLGASLEGFRVVQACLSMGSVLLLWWVTRLNLGPRTALWAAALVRA